MSQTPSENPSHVPAEAIHDAMLEAARRKRSLRPLVLSGIVIGGLAGPGVTSATADEFGGRVLPPETVPTQPAPAMAEPVEQAPPSPEPQAAMDPPAPAVQEPVVEIAQEPQPMEPQQVVPAAAEAIGRGRHIRRSKEPRRRDATRTGSTSPGLIAQQTPGMSAAQVDLGGFDLAAAKSVPKAQIESFQIPPFLLPIYQAAGAQHGIRWEVLAAINEIETDYGRNLNISSAGAQGWMQFMPPTWRQYGTDANRDGVRDPYNPVDAIFAAARYLKAAGAATDLRRAIWAYNHADWYVRDVLKRARRIAATPPALVDALAGLSEGRFPVAGSGKMSATRSGALVHATGGSAVVAVQDGRVVSSGTSERLGHFIRIRDAQGTVYTYSQLGGVGLEREGSGWARELPETTMPAPDLPDEDDPHEHGEHDPGDQAHGELRPAWPALPPMGELQAAFVSPEPAAADAEAAAAAPEPQPAEEPVVQPRRGMRVLAGTVLGRVSEVAAIGFGIKPSGSGRIDPLPVLKGWRLLQDTALFRVRGRAAGQPGQVLLMSKEALQHRVLHDERITIYECGRQDVQTGVIDRRVLATMAFLAESGLHPTISSLNCGHSYLTASGNVSAHSSGNAVDVAAINGTPIIGNQGEGSITDRTIRRLLTLQGAMRPNQIISLMKYSGASNTLVMSDHADHIHVGFPGAPGTSTGTGAALSNTVLKPRQWDDLMQRLAQIENPGVSTKPSRHALKVARKRARSRAKEAAAAAAREQALGYDSYQEGVKDPFMPPWLARNH